MSNPLVSLLATAPDLPAPLFQEGHEGTLVQSTDVVSQSIVGALIVGIFVLLTMEAAHRVLVVFAATALVWLISYLTPCHLISFQDGWHAVDVNVLVLLGSMMAVVGVLKQTGFFDWAVTKMLNSAKGQPRLIQVVLSWFTGITSAFLDNVTTVIFVTPMATGMSKKMKIRPVAILLPMVIASNVGGTATLIGDPPNIMIGSNPEADLSFMDFIETLTAPILVCMVVLQWFALRYYRSDLHEPEGDYEPEPVPAPTDPALLRWMLVICGLILLGFFTHAATGMPVSVPALIGAAAALVVQDRLYLKRNRPTAHERAHGILEVIEREIEWPTLSFFFFLFIIVGAAVQTGLIESIAHGLEWSIFSVQEALSLTEAGTLAFAAIFICWVSAVLSAFIDNIPYVAVAIPIVAKLTETLPSPSGPEGTEVLWWALALGACLGGNGTAVGASANVTSMGLAEKQGVRIGFAEFMRFGMPAMIITVAISSLFLASHVYLGEVPARWVGWAVAVPMVLIGFVTLRGRPRTA